MAVQLACADVGVACGAVHRAATVEDLLAQVAAHAREKHGVVLTQTLIDYAADEARTT
ncbi:MAG TPA: DUF1059 domain-containing protein [Egibacteraceae bacterium]|jgi:predicted small metal-binding protein|nr:DUF1059 domain-containing protein [Egibacteraceae bacterium]